MEKWPIEPISVDSLLYRKIHKGFIDPKNKLNIRPSFFANKQSDDPDLSTDWNRYHSAEDARKIIGLEFKYGTEIYKNPNDVFIVSVNVGEIINLNINQEIIHTPVQNIPEIVGSPNNRSHASILGDKTDEQIRLKLASIANWEIKPE